MPSIKHNGKEIAPVTVAKNLRILLDQSLNDDEQISKTVSKCVLKLIQVNRIKHLLAIVLYFIPFLCI